MTPNAESRRVAQAMPARAPESAPPILLATDFTEACERALVEAVRFASAEHAQLHILHVVKDRKAPKGAYNHPHWDHAGFPARAKLDAIEHDVAQSYPDTVARLVRGTSEAAGILKYAQDTSAGFIVMGTHGHGPVAELLLGSVAQRVVRDARIPVLVVGYSSDKDRGPGVLAAVDFSPSTEGVLRRAAQLARHRRAPLTVFHALGPESRTTEARAREALGQRVAAAMLEVRGAVAVASGAAADGVLTAAQRYHAGLIVIGPSHHKTKARLAAGVAGQLLRRARCPVLVHREVPASVGASS